MINITKLINGLLYENSHPLAGSSFPKKQFASKNNASLLSAELYNDKVKIITALGSDYILKNYVPGHDYEAWVLPVDKIEGISVVSIEDLFDKLIVTL